MARFCVIQTPATTWQQEGRFESAVGAPLTEQGRLDVLAAAEQLASEDISVIYSADGDAERQTARLLAGKLNLTVRTNRNLREVDYGLWQGLTVKEVKRRQPKIYKQWLESPTSVCPPQGETVEHLQDRLEKALAAISAKSRATPLIVLRPMSMGTLKCMFKGDSLDLLGKNVDPQFGWCIFEAGEKGL